MDTSYLNTKKIRKSQNLSLRELSAKSGLSISFLSNYENGKTNITVTALRKIAESLGVPIRLLLTTDEEEKILVVRKKERSSVHRGKSEAFRQMLTKGPFYDMKVSTVLLKEGEVFESADVYDGQEFIYALSGKVTVWVNEKEIVLEPGDMLYYDAALPHYCRNQQEETTEFLMVCSKAEGWS